MSAQASVSALQSVEIKNSPKPVRWPDFGILAGIAIAIGAVIAGIAKTGIHLSYFFQPTGALIVLGGTLGVTFITTPHSTIVRSFRRAFDLMWTRATSRETLVEEVVSLSKTIRARNVLALEPVISSGSHPFLREALQLAVDIRNRAELQEILERNLRLRERQGEADAKVLEVAGGFAPTIGVLGTVVGLIDVLKQFSDISSVAAGTGTAFVSTIYGLGLANLILLPAAHRIRSSVADLFETHELIVEGTLGLFDGLHPSLLRERLTAFVPHKESRG